MNETDSTRLDSHDFSYSNGSYTYVGGNQNFSGVFLKEALCLLFALATDDVDACEEKLKAAGYEVFVEPKNIVIP